MSIRARLLGLFTFLCILLLPRAHAGDPAPADASWQRSIEQDLAAREYHASMIEGGQFTASNRAQNLRVTYGVRGIEVRPRVDDDAAFEWRLAFAGVGRGTRIAKSETATPRANGNRVEYAHGDVTEWYVNDTRGVEHGFTLASRPAGAGDLVVELTVSGTLTPLERADAVEFVKASGAVAIRYDHLAAFDADGNALGASLRVAGDTIRIVVDDADANYPVTIDPLTTSPAWTAESNQSFAGFGLSVATAGDVNGDGYSDVIVGAPYFTQGLDKEGRAFLYLGSAAGLALSPAWMATSGHFEDLFGISVSTAGDVNGDGFSDVIIGAEWFDTVFGAGQTNEGRAFVYLGSAAGLGLNPAWTADGGQVNSSFGSVVATAGDVNGDGYSDVIVGARFFDNGETNEGRAFVYHGSATGLAASPAWTAESNQASALFGDSVATAGDVNGDGFADVTVGASNYSNGQNLEGRAYVYHGSAGGVSSSPAWIKEIDQGGAGFGHSVSTAGDVNGDGYADVIVGAFACTNGENFEGLALVYHGSSAGLGLVHSWTAESNQVGARFGWSVATAGDVNCDGYSDVIVGAPFFDDGQANEGRAYVYLGAAPGLAPAPAWVTDESDQVQAQFGVCVATAGDIDGDGFSDVVVGALGFGEHEMFEGRTYAYVGFAAALAPAAAWTGESDQSDCQFGVSVASAGDVNGDGFTDVIVGSDMFDNGENNEGRVFVYLGSTTGLGQSPAWTVESNQADALFGGSVATAGDVNGDGYSDVIIGAYTFDDGQIDEGAAFVYLGSPTGLGASPAWTAQNNEAGTNFGWSVGTAGDVNGDGFSDVIVGAPFVSAGQTYEGRAYVYLGSALGLAASPAWIVESNKAQAKLGSCVATAGDVNRDGFSDVIVGAPQFNAGQINEGRAYVYLGSAAGLASNPVSTVTGATTSILLGASVATAGDVNGDGFSDVIIGARFVSNGQVGEGRAFVYAGSATGLGASPAWTAESNQAFAEFGNSVATAGDVNGDGFSDVIVGAHFFDNGQTEEGGAFLYLGSAAGLAVTSAWSAESDQAAVLYGNCVATAGDVNGDGYSDVIVGAYGFDNDQLDEGRAFTYHGNAGLGRTVKPRIRRADDSAPIASLGRTLTGSYLAKLVGRSPFGRGKVKLAVESKPLGTSFDGTGLTQSALLDTGLTGNDASVTVNGLVAHTAYHWRARIVHDKATTPFLPAGPWFSVQGNSPTETDLRTDVCGGLLASATGYGAGKAGTVGVPVLSSSTPPASGAFTNVTLTGGLPGASPVVLMLGLAPAALPFDGGTLLVNPTFVISLPPLSAGGSITLPVQIGAQPAMCGVHAYMQVLFFDPGAAGFYQTAQTNGLDWQIGS